MVNFWALLEGPATRRKCERAVTQIGRSASLLWDGTMFQAFTPDGEISDEQDEELVEEMYRFQEDLIGFLSFWPRLSVNGFQEFIDRAGLIRNNLPAEFELTKNSLIEIEELISDSLPLLGKCAP